MKQARGLPEELGPLNPRRHRGGVDATPPKVFLRWPKNGGVQRRQTWIAYGASFAHLLAEKFGRGHVRSWSYDVISGTTFDRFFGKSHRLC